MQTKIILTRAGLGLFILFPVFCLIYRNLFNIPLSLSFLLLVAYYVLLAKLYIEFRTKTTKLFGLRGAFEATPDKNPKIYLLTMLINLVLFAIFAFALWDTKPISFNKQLKTDAQKRAF